MTSRTRRQLSLALGFAAFFAALWYFWYTPVVYPLKIFVVLLHELSHAVALWVTGGAVESISLDPRQGGLTVGRGGSAFITLSAGYLGSLAFGALLVMGAGSKRIRSSALLAVVGGSVLVLTLLYIRGGFGIAYGLATGVVLLAGARYLSAIWAARLITGLGLTSVGYAILDIKSDIIDRPGLQSDAAMLAELTGVPTLFWGFLWIGIAIWAAIWLFRHTIRRA
ncbi:MAG TPA: M50 family metallopeptidase [Longimicrobiales bacterium]|nr:M50 family metallopeptidase [Longimicrobiales bacterium]